MHATLVTPGTICLTCPGCCWGNTPLTEGCYNGITPKSGVCSKGIVDH